jgi:hypothetical protein
MGQECGQPDLAGVSVNRGRLDGCDFVLAQTFADDIKATCERSVAKRPLTLSRHPATVDGLVEPGGAVFEAKFMLPWTFSEEAAAEKHMAQLQHNMWVVNARSAVLSIITGGGKWVEVVVRADPLYQHLLLTAEKKFWRRVVGGEEPRLFGVEPPRPRLEAVRSVDMSASNSWAAFSETYQRTRQAHLDHEDAKAELKKLVPEDAKEAFGHGVKAKRSKSGAISHRAVSLRANRSIGLRRTRVLQIRVRMPSRLATFCLRAPRALELLLNLEVPIAPETEWSYCDVDHQRKRPWQAPAHRVRAACGSHE